MSFSGINTSYTAIRAAQLALNTTSHNIANANTAGYTRQRVTTGALGALATTVGMVGAGVDTLDITRQRDAFLDDRARAESGLAGQAEARSSLLGQAEVRFGELDAGIDVAMSDLFASLEELSLHPESSPVRQTVLGAMDAVAARIRSTATGVSALQTSAVGSVQGMVSDINGQLDAIAELNREIVALSGSGTANDLMDERDRLVDDLARQAGVTVLPTGDGAVRISLGGLSLLDRTVVTHLAADANGSVTHPDGPISAGGELGGTQRFLKVDLPAMLSDLDDLATNIATAFNDRNAAGYRMDGTAGEDLFDATGGAGQLRMVAGAPGDLAVAGSNPPAMFDGTNAASLADLRTADLAGQGSLLEQFRRVVTGVGVAAARADTDARNQRAMSETAALARESQHGVSLDEEMANLITHQRSLEAAARVMSAMDEALSTLINRTGVVGR